MKLISCHIEAFGKLNRFDCTFGSGLNTLVRENGWGKSAFAAFIRVMFYGFDGEGKRREGDRERVRYAPWGGGVYGGNLVFESEKGRFRIERTFGAKDRSRDTYALYDDETGLISSVYGTEIGTELFGLDAESFQRTVFIRQKDLAPRGVPSKIQARITDAGPEDGGNFDAASAVLRSRQNALSPRRSTGEIWRLDAEIARKESLLRQEDGLLRAEEGTKVLLAGLQEQKRRMLARQEALLTDEGASGRGGQDRPADDPFRDEGKEQRDRKAPSGRGSYLNTRKTCSILFSVLMALIAIYPIRAVLREGLVRNGKPTQAALLLLLEAGITAVGMVIIRLCCSGGRPNSSGRRQERGAIKAGELSEENLGKTGGLSGDDPGKTDAAGFESNEQIRTRKFRQSQAEVEDLSEQIHSCEEKLSQIRSRLDELGNMRMELAADRERRDRLQHQYEICEKTLTFLTQAQVRCTSRYLGPVQSAFQQYMGWMDDLPCFLDAKMNISFTENGVTHESSFLSEGMQDLVGLAWRVAVADAMYEREKPVLILDDPLVKLDDRKLDGAKQFLTQTAGRYQIIYLTCSTARA